MTSTPLRRTTLTLFALATIALICTITISRVANAAGPTPLAAQPHLILPGDTATGPAAYGQDNSQIAAGANGYLVVWEDSRTNYIGILDGASTSGGDPSGQLLKDIYAARLDANGQLIDTTPIVVSQATWSQKAPQVSWNGQNWLVVWNTERQTDSSSTVDVVAARVSPQGVVLDNPAIVIDNNPAVDELLPTVASDGTNWVVVWMDQGSYFELDAARIAPDGQVLDPGGVAIHTPGFPDAPYNVAIAYATDEFLLTWSGNNMIKGLLISPTLQHIGGVFTISSGGNLPEVASDSTNFYTAWQVGGVVQGVGVSHTGQVLGSPINISGNHSGFPTPDVSWDGTQYWVSWVSSANSDYAARISPNGTLLDPNGIMVAATAYISTIAGRPGGGAIAAWTDFRVGGVGGLDIYSATISTDGVVDQSFPVSLGAPSQIRPDLAANGTGYMAVFMSVISGETRIKAQRLGADGNAIDAEPILIAGGSRSFTKPRVAWNGTVYLVIWEDSSICRGFVCGTTLGKRVAPDGTVLDPAPIEILPGNAPDVAALGTTFLVVDTFESTNHFRYPQAVRVDGAGTVLGSPVSIGTIYSVAPRVVALGSRWLAVWEQHPSHDSPYASIYGAFVNADGSTTGSFVVSSNSLVVAKTPDMAAGSGQALIAYYGRGSGDVTQGDVFARRIATDGTFLDSVSGIQVTSAINAQFLPAAIWTGSEYLVAYEDNRNVPYLDRPVSDIYATRVGGDGSVIAPNGFPVANSFIPEVTVTLASQNNSYLLAFANFKYMAPYAAYRIDVRAGQAGSPPNPETTATPAAATSTATTTRVSTSTVSATTSIPTSTVVSTGTGIPASATASSTRVPSSATAATTSTPVRTSTPPTSSTTTPVRTATPTSPSASTSTVTPVATETTATPTSTSVPTSCAITFSDVPQGSTFYQYVMCLACKGILGGYSDGTFRTNNLITRGQIAKIAANAANITDDPGDQIYSDVDPASTFYLWINRLSNRGFMSGYRCGGPGEPCDDQNRPYFRPFANATRGQIAKIISNAAGFNDPATGQSFEDVAPDNAFYDQIQRLTARGVMSGYPCGDAGEPCGPDNLPYFRPNSNATRGQTAKIVSNSFYPNCQTLQH